MIKYSGTECQDFNTFKQTESLSGFVQNSGIPHCVLYITLAPPLMIPAVISSKAELSK